MTQMKRSHKRRPVTRWIKQHADGAKMALACTNRSLRRALDKLEQGDGFGAALALGKAIQETAIATREVDAIRNGKQEEASQ
jgi:hypothetical protein